MMFARCIFYAFGNRLARVLRYLSYHLPPSLTTSQKFLLNKSQMYGPKAPISDNDKQNFIRSPGNVALVSNNRLERQYEASDKRTNIKYFVI